MQVGESSPGANKSLKFDDSPIAKSMPIKIEEFLRQSVQGEKKDHQNKIKHVEDGATELLLGADIASFKVMQQEKMKMSF